MRVGGGSPITAAGPCRTHTGFPILPGHLAAPGTPDRSPGHAPETPGNLRHLANNATTIIPQTDRSRTRPS